MRKIKAMVVVMALAAATSRSFAGEPTGTAAGAKAPQFASKNVPVILALSLGSATAIAIGVSSGSSHGNNMATSSTPSTR